jgi:hypothetical protein
VGSFYLSLQTSFLMSTGPVKLLRFRVNRESVVQQMSSEILRNVRLRLHSAQDDKLLETLVVEKGADFCGEGFEWERLLQDGGVVAFQLAAEGGVVGVSGHEKDFDLRTDSG